MPPTKHLGTLKRKWWAHLKRPPPDLPPEERERLIREYIEAKGITRCPCQFKPLP